MSEQLIERLLELNDRNFRLIVDDESRRRIGNEHTKSLRLVERMIPGPRPAREEGKPDPRNYLVADALASPQLVERWYNDLTAMKGNIEAQIAARKAELRSRRIDPDYDALATEYHRWRAGVLRFLTAVEDRLVIARRALNKYVINERAKALLDDRDRLGHRTSALIMAIRRHKEATETNFGDVTDADTELWSWIT